MKELCFDISSWQDNLNYGAVRNRTNYCILRAGFDTTLDSRFYEHYDNLEGLNLGAYWYSYATNVEEARSEAKKFLDVIEDRKFTLPLFLDIEDPSQSGLGRDTLNSIVEAFGEIIENAGYYFGVYTNLNWYRNIISGSELNKKYDWWIACWSDEAPSNVDYGVWQFTSDYNDFGTRLDANWVIKDYPSIIREAGLNHLTDEPTPVPTPTPTPTPEPSEDLLDIVRKTIRGDFGNGEERYKLISELGFDPEEVQYQVNMNYYHGTTNWDNVRLY